MTAINAKPALYTRKQVRRGGRHTISHKIIMKNDKIVVPVMLKRRLMGWYHDMLMHPGITRMTNTIGMHFTWSGMAKDIESLCKKCWTCQLTKKTKKKYGHLPPRRRKQHHGTHYVST